MTYRIAWATCKHGHDMTDPTNVYTRPNGSRYCRRCLNRPARKPKADKHAMWALKAWAAMTPRERRLVRNALSELDLKAGR